MVFRMSSKLSLVPNTHDRERHRRVFTRLNPKRMVIGGSFREAGYWGVEVDKSIIPDMGEVLVWCHEQYDTRYAFISGWFWFLTEEDALFFRFTWSKR